MSENCIFCKIVSGEVPAKHVVADEHVIAFHDIRPQAPVHILIIPKKHIQTIDDIEPDDKLLIGEMFLVAKRLAREVGVSDSGYRLVLNCRRDAGQDVYHIHLHLLAGRKFTWPPG